MNERIAVDFAGAANQKTGMVLVCEPQKMQRAQRVRLKRLDRVPLVVFRARPAREMENEVHGFGNRERLADVVRDHHKVFVCAEIGDIFCFPGCEIIHTKHAVPLFEE